MFRFRSFALIAVLAATGCTRADVLRIDNTPRPETNPESIQLLGQEPTRPYTVIAIVTARGQGAVSQARARLLKEAAHLGGHAVLFDTNSMTEVGGDQSTEKQLSAKVIVYTDSTRSN